MSDAGPDPKQSLRRLIIFSAVGSVAFLMGAYGFAEYDRLKVGSDAPFKLTLGHVYYTVQLFVLEGSELTGSVPLALHFARFLAPFALAGGLWSFLSEVFEEPLRAWRLRRIEGHLVVIGEGAVADRFADNLCEESSAVVHLVPSGEAPEMRPGFIGVSGDPTSDRVLARAGIRSSRSILLVDSRDDLNIEVAAAVDAFLSRGASGRRIPCRIHVNDPDLRYLVDRQRSQESYRNIGAALFNIYDAEARRILVEHPLDREHIRAGDKRAVHLAVVGFGRMGRALVHQAVRQGHYANGTVRITIYDREAEALKRRFDRRYPGLSELVTIEFVTQQVHEPALRDRLLDAVGDAGELTTLAICLPDESANAVLALQLFPELQRRSTPAWVRVPRQAGLRHVLMENNQGLDRDILIPFGALSETCRSEAIRDEMLEQLARRIHQEFRERRHAEGYELSGPTRFAWEELDEEYRASNREQADHIATKLRAVGLRLTSASDALRPVTALDADDVELLARMEHDRWWAERCLAGWRYGEEKDAERRVSPYLAPWAGIPADIQEYDRQAVRDIPALVARAGLAIHD